MNEELKALSESDVEWDGTYIGLNPAVDGKKLDQLRSLGEAIIPELIAMLSDESKFSVAHVFLTYLSRVQYESFPTWNGLTVGLSADGRVNIDASQRFTLARRWDLWYRTEPHPISLPSP